jgi:hypothetical protein
MRTGTALAIGELQTIGALVPALRDVVSDIEVVLRTLDADASRPHHIPALPPELVPDFKPSVSTGNDYTKERRDLADKLEEWIGAQAILPPEVAAAPEAVVTPEGVKAIEGDPS